MEITITWSELSEQQVKQIFDYYSSEAGSKIAERLINKIIKRVEILYKNPFSGTKEELLSDYTEEYRYLVVMNYKIIYCVENLTITIMSVFDCRQSPDKIKVIK